MGKFKDVEDRLAKRRVAVRELARLMKANSLLKDIDYCSDQCVQVCLLKRIREFREEFTEIREGKRFWFPRFNKYSHREVYHEPKLQLQIKDDCVEFWAVYKHVGVEAAWRPIYNESDYIGKFNLTEGEMYYSGYTWWK